MVFEYSDYRQFLKADLEARIKRNPSFSLRAMAKLLGIQGSQLCEVMRGKAGFSPATAVKVAHGLGLQKTEVEYFCSLVQLASASDPASREILMSRLNELRPHGAGRPVHDLSVDHYRQISDWYHSAILQLADLKGFELSAESAAAELGITKLEAEVALERLARLELLTRTEDGRWSRIPEDIQFVSPESNAALKTFYQQMLKKTSEAVEDQPFGQRLSAYQTISMPLSAMPAAEKLFDEFMEKFLRLARDHQGPEHVYHLSLHFFDLTPNLNAKPNGRRK